MSNNEFENFDSERLLLFAERYEQIFDFLVSQKGFSAREARQMILRQERKILNVKEDARFIIDMMISRQFESDENDLDD